MTSITVNIDALRTKAEATAQNLPPLIAAAERIAETILQGEHALRRTGSGEKFWQFREYHSGDRPQDIDWRQSAKTGNVYVRQKERQTPQAHIFWCASSPGMEYTSGTAQLTKKEAGQILSLSLAILFAHGGEQVAGFESPRGIRGESGLQRLCEYYAGERAAESLPDLGQARIAQNSFLVLVGDFLDPLENIRESLESLSASTANALVLQVLDRDELELPFAGNAIFENTDDHSRIPVEHVPSIRSAYQERINNHVKSVEELCAGLGWHYYLHRSDSNMEAAAAALWQMLGRHQ